MSCREYPIMSTTTEGHRIAVPAAMADVDAVLCASIVRVREAQSASRHNEACLRQELAVVSQHRDALAGTTATSAAAVQRLETDAARHRAKIQELLVAGAKMEALLREAVAENQRLLRRQEEEKEAGGPALVAPSLSVVEEAENRRPTMAATAEDTEWARPHRTHHDGNDDEAAADIAAMPLGCWSFDTDPDAFSFVWAHACRDGAMPPTANNSHREGAAASFLLAVAAAVRLNTQPECDSDAHALCLADAASCCMRWRRCYPKGQACEIGQPECVDQQGKRVWWPHAAWWALLNDEEARTGTASRGRAPPPHGRHLAMSCTGCDDGRAPLELLMQWHPAVVAVDSGALWLATPTEFLNRLAQWHDVLLTEDAVVRGRDGGRNGGGARTVLLLEATGKQQRPSSGACVLITSSVMLGLQQMLYVVHCSHSSDNGQDGDAVGGTAPRQKKDMQRTGLTARGEWLTADGVARLVAMLMATQSCSTDGTNNHHGNDSGASDVCGGARTDSGATTLGAVGGSTPQQGPQPYCIGFHVVSNVGPTAVDNDGIGGYARITFPATCSVATGCIEPTLACSWDAWSTRDFGSTVVQTAQGDEVGGAAQVGGDDSTPSPTAAQRRAVAFLVPHENNAFAFRCVSWIRASPVRRRRRSDGDGAAAAADGTVRCSVTCYIRRGHTGTNDYSTPTDTPRHVRLLSTAPGPVGRCGSRRRPRRVLAQIDGRDVCLEEGCWFPIDDGVFGSGGDGDRPPPPGPHSDAPGDPHRTDGATPHQTTTSTTTSAEMLPKLCAWRCCGETLQASASCLMEGIDAHWVAFSSSTAAAATVSGGAAATRFVPLQVPAASLGAVAASQSEETAPPPSRFAEGRAPTAPLFPSTAAAEEERTLLLLRIRSLEEQLAASEHQSAVLRASHDCMSSAADAYRRRVGDLEVELEETLVALHSLKGAHRRIVERAASAHHQATMD